MKLALILVFFVTALLYSAVGFGGGSTYTALLILADIDYRLIPILALSCNLIVVSGNSIRFSRAGLISWRQIWPFIALSVPAAWLGASLILSEYIFTALLAAALLLAGLRLLLARTLYTAERAKHIPVSIKLIIGAAIGFYSGLIGIGGGILLSPVLYSLGWDTPKRIAAASSVFIFVNSIAGLTGQMGKLSQMGLLSEGLSYWPLFPAVLIGGFIGNRLGIFALPSIWVKRLTGLLILGVAIRLMIRLAA